MFLVTSCAYYFLLWFLSVSLGCFVLPAFSPKWLIARAKPCALARLFFVVRDVGVRALGWTFKVHLIALEIFFLSFLTLLLF